MRIKLILTLELLFFFCSPSFSQLTATGNKKKIDSLFLCLQIFENKDTNRVNTLISLGYEYSVLNFSEAKYYLTIAEHLARNLNYKKGIANSLSYLGIAYETQGEYFEALNAQISALKIREEIGDKSGISYSAHYIGDIYFGQCDLSEKISLKEEYINKALEQYYKALKTAEEIKDEKSISNTFNCIGNCFREQNKYSSALEYYLKAVKIRERLDDKINLSTTFVNIGKLYLKEGNYSIALEYLNKALKLSEELGHKRTNIKALGTVATVYYLQKQYTKSINFCLKSIQLAEKVGYLEYIIKANKLLSQIYSDYTFKGRNSDKAFAYYKQYIKYKDSVDTKKANQLELQFEFNKKNEVAIAQQEKKDELAREYLRKQKIIRNSSICGFTLMLLFAIISFRNYKRKQKDNSIISQQKQLVEQKNKEITDSIKYALRLQTAILPPQKLIKETLENSFILYKPKDIVAGDFYWMETINETVLFAACDCTGHGVPGAMVSVICHNALNRAVREFGLTQPAEILDKTAEIVIEDFSKSEEEIKDGMDISICSYDPNTKIIEWAGANNPLWLLQNGELIETKANKQPIGMNDHKKPFTNHTFKLNSGDTIYLFTDGFPDQFGGETGEKKLTRKRFKELILSIQNKSLLEQCITLDKFIIDYRKGVEQIDDILVMGVRV